MKSIVSRRAVTAAIVTVGIAAATLVGTATPAAANACPMNYDCVTTWYSDSSRTTRVGGEWTDCYGHTASWGTRTGYMTHTRRAC